MSDILALFKRNINQLFGICVDILTVGRSLQQLSISMQILANNGVVQAAKVGGGKGRPMLALVEILNHIPKEIRPGVQAVEQLCASVARLTASSSNLVWRYHQLIGGLLAGTRQDHHTATEKMDETLSDLHFTTATDVVALMRHLLSMAHAGPLERENFTFIATHCQTNLADLQERLRETLRCLGNIRKALSGLKRIGMTARYMAFSIASEAAGLAEAAANFKRLSAEISQVVDDLDAKTLAMKTAIDHGEELVELLLKGRAHAK